MELVNGIHGLVLSLVFFCSLSFLDAAFFAFFAYSWKLPAYSGVFYLQLTIFAFLVTVGTFLLTTSKRLPPSFFLSEASTIDDRQITHLISARLKYDLYDLFRGCFGPASFLFLV